MTNVVTIVKEEPRNDTKISTDWQTANVPLNAHCDQLLTVKEEVLSEMKLKGCIKREIDQKLMKLIKKEPLDEMEMSQQLRPPKDEFLLDKELLPTFNSTHQSEPLAGNVSSLACPSSSDDYDNMPSDWFTSASSDSDEEEETDEEPVAVSASSVHKFPTKDEPPFDDKESLSAFASTQPASPSIVIKGETCPCTGDCPDCIAKRSPCPECGKAFGCNSQLIRHLRVHTGERPFVCTQCPKAFTQSGALKQHQSTHQAVRSKPFRCTAEGCGKAFPRKGELKVHFRFHTGNKPYKCDTCGKAFTTSGHLTIHTRSHTGIKPHKCDICGKAFTTKTELTLHFRSHTGERPYRCPLCPKAFATSSQAKSHQRNIHPEF